LALAFVEEHRSRDALSLFIRHNQLTGEQSIDRRFESGSQLEQIGTGNLEVLLQIGPKRRVAGGIRSDGGGRGDQRRVLRERRATGAQYRYRRKECSDTGRPFGVAQLRIRSIM